MITDVRQPLLFAVADLLQVPLHAVGEGYKNTVNRKFKIGPWDFEVTLLIKSDVLTKDLASFWVRVWGDLWMYVVSYNDGKALKIMTFSGAAAKLEKGMMVTSCVNGNLAESLKRLKAAGAIGYTFKAGKWATCPIDIKEAV